MHIFIDRWSDKKWGYRYFHKHGGKFQTSHKPGEMKEMVKDAFSYHQKKESIVLLLDEDHFDLYTVDLDFCATEKITVRDVQLIVNERLGYIKTHYKAGGEKLYYLIDNISVNDQEKPYILGEVGTVHATLTFVFLQKRTANVIKSTFGRDMSKIKIYPQSFYTVGYLKKSLRKPHLQLLYVFDEYAKVITLTHGKYTKCERIDLGVRMLKDIYKENNVLPYFFKSAAEIEMNEFAKWLVVQSVDFFVETLMRWMKEFVKPGQDLIIVSSLIWNTYFLDRLNQQYKKNTNGFIVPLHHTNDLHTFQRQRESDEIDVLTMLNFAQ